MPVYRTQKARGLATIAAAADVGISWLEVPKLPHVLPHTAPNTWRFPMFARPCPTRPRHGFVESKLVHSLEDVLGLYCDARKVDPQAEVMLMEYIKGPWSAILSASGIVYGAGHDGATAGRGKQYAFPVPFTGMTEGYKSPEWGEPQVECTHFDRFWWKRFSSAASGIDTSHYVELVLDQPANGGSLRTVVTQLRDGPLVTVSQGLYVPTADYAVKDVVVLHKEPDLLEWEARVKKLRRGTCIVMHFGTLSAHAAVHGIAHGLAVWCKPALPAGAKAPEKGDILQPADNQPPALTKADFAYMARMLEFVPAIRTAKNYNYGNVAQCCAAAIASLHAQPAWGREKHLLAMRVVGAVWAFQALSAACIGEARHFYRQGPGRCTEGATPAIDWRALVEGKPVGARGEWEDVSAEDKRRLFPSSYDRSSVFTRVFLLTWPDVLPYTRAAEKDFSGSWGGSVRYRYDCDGTRKRGSVTGSCGYGGPKWRNSARIARKLGEALVAFRAKPSADSWAAVLAAYNLVISAAHNNGLLFDKFMGQSEINHCVHTPQLGLAAPCVGNVLATVATAEGLKPPRRKVIKRTAAPTPAAGPEIAAPALEVVA